MSLRAIAAMSLNRVIGKDGKIPWHIPDDFKWFKETTTGQAILMGRKTYESLGRPLPNRRNLVVTRGPIPAGGIELIRNLDSFDAADYPCDVWVIGGGEIYRQMLPRCEAIYLSVIPITIDGDVFFPPFEEDFAFSETLLTRPEFEVRKYIRRDTPNAIESSPARIDNPRPSS